MTANQVETIGVRVSRIAAQSDIVLICEHASHFIPDELNELGLSAKARHSHVAWDPGALAVAEALSEELDAVLIASSISRLVYDCNRPPHAADAIPLQSEAYDIPGNHGLTKNQKSDRIARYYFPFRDAVVDQLAKIEKPIIITIHSFTPIYLDTKRDVEIGILYDEDRRLADALFDVARRSKQYVVRRNEPYGPQDGVTHTLKEHAIPHGHLNVMLEIRNDLIAEPNAQLDMAKTLSSWITNAITKMEAAACRD